MGEPSITLARPVVHIAPLPGASSLAKNCQKKSKAKLYQRTRQPSSIRLENRDVEVLEALATHRFLSGEQLRRLIFRCGPSMVRRRLRALYDHRLIARVAMVAQPTQGIPPFVYVLGKDGAGVLAETGREASPGAGNSLRIMRHRYLINEFLVTLIEAARGTPWTVAEWRHEEELLMPAPGGLTRPEQVVHRLLTRPMPFLPDGYCQLRSTTGELLSYFVEIDRATHPLRVWRERARLYGAYADPLTGLFRRRFQQDRFRLLIVTTPDYRGRSRRDNIMAALRQGSGPADLFLATTVLEIRTERILGPIWRTIDGKSGSLLPNVTVRPRSPAATLERPVVVRATV